jgi:protease-4
MVDFIIPKKDDGKDKKKNRIFGFNFSLKNFLMFFFIFLIISSLISSYIESVTPKISVVPIKGPILVENQDSLFQSASSSRDIVETINHLAEDDSVKIIVLDINSPGGTPVATEEISNSIIKAREKKPVYAVISDVGASGAFWIAVSADKVYASKMSILGSIGVTSATLGFEDFIKEYNISYRRLTAGEYKDMGSPYRNMTSKEEKMFQQILDEVHRNFIEHVANSRNLPITKVKEFGNGQIFLGTTAKTEGFIDDHLTFQELINKLKTENKGIEVRYFEKETTLAQALGLNSIIPSFSTPKQQLLLQ